MALARSWVFPQTATESTVNEQTTHTAQTGGPGFVLNADALSVPNIVTAPANSASVYAPASYTANTASVATIVQNTLGYDALFTGYFFGSPSVATFTVGVGSTATPAMTAVSGGVTQTTGLLAFPAYVPANYYYSFQVSQANAASVPSAQLAIQATPV